MIFHKMHRREPKIMDAFDGEPMFRKSALESEPMYYVGSWIKTDIPRSARSVQLQTYE